MLHVCSSAHRSSSSKSSSSNSSRSKSSSSNSRQRLMFVWLVLQLLGESLPCGNPPCKFQWPCSSSTCCWGSLQQQQQQQPVLVLQPSSLLLILQYPTCSGTAQLADELLKISGNLLLQAAAAAFSAPAAAAIVFAATAFAAAASAAAAVAAAAAAAGSEVVGRVERCAESREASGPSLSMHCLHASSRGSPAVLLPRLLLLFRLPGGSNVWRG
ncbi:hypothetical protein Emag_006939 [Eimeria magna]